MDSRNQSRKMICRGIENEIPVGEQRIWTAVLRQALEDWKGMNLRARNAAEQFLFGEKDDFETVCAYAGINASSFRERLSRYRRIPHAATNWRTGLAA